MDTVYEFFYLTMLISVILLAITAILYRGDRRHKIWGYVFNVLVVIILCSLVGFIGFIVTIP